MTRALFLAALPALALSACSPRYGYQPDDPETLFPRRGPVEYMMDNRYPPPSASHIPETLPKGVYKPEHRPVPAPLPTPSAADHGA